MIDRYIDQLIKSDDFCEIFRRSDNLIEYLYNLYELGYIVVKLDLNRVLEGLLKEKGI